MISAAADLLINIWMDFIFVVAVVVIINIDGLQCLIGYARARLCSHLMLRLSNDDVIRWWLVDDGRWVVMIFLQNSPAHTHAMRERDAWDDEGRCLVGLMMMMMQMTFGRWWAAVDEFMDFLQGKKRE